MKLAEVQEKHAEETQIQADFEAQQKANCAALSEKVRQTKPYCKNYQQ